MTPSTVGQDRSADPALPRYAQLPPSHRIAVLGLLDALVVLAYVVATGTASLVGLIAVVALGAGLMGSVLLVPRWLSMEDRAAQTVMDMAAAVIRPALLFVLLTFVVSGAVLPLSPLVGIQVLAAAYTLPRRMRVPAQVWVVVAFLAALWITGNRSPVVWVLQCSGAVVLMALARWVAAGQDVGAEAAQRSRDDAEALNAILASVLRVNSLEPRAVLSAVTEGLMSLGFALVEIRRVDTSANVARLMAGASSFGRRLEPEIPADAGLLGEVLSRRETMVLPEFDDHPASQDRGLGYRGAMLVPLVLGDGGRGVLAAVSGTGPLTPIQQEAVTRLVDHATGALRRASAFEADAQVVADLRHLDERTQDFVSTASHELRTPLTVISGLGQTLRRRWDDLDDGRREDLLQRIEANADRLMVMVRSLLNTSALDRGELVIALEPVKLRPVIERLLDRLATVTAAHPVELEVPEDLEVLVDAGLFEHVIENLLTNVAKHTPQGTAVLIHARRTGEVVDIAVRDFGPGIATEDMPHILDRFYRGGDPTRRETGGLGLGLALAQQIVRAHGSELTVESQPGRGTTFRCQVPVA